MRVIIQPYGASKSARLLSNAIKDLGLYDKVFRIKKAGFSNYQPRESDVIINWGSQAERFDPKYYINQPSCIANASNKLKAFTRMKEIGVKTPEWTTEKTTAISWLVAGHTVYARTSVSGHSGSGIVICSPDETHILPDAPLYTKKVNVDEEYRIHVCKVADDDYIVFDQQQKKRKSRDDGQVANPDIRNHSNGWIFARRDLCVPERVQVEAINAVKALGLDFGGVDVAYSREDRRAYVYEVNTACGLEGSSLGKYAEMLANLIERKTNAI